ncbi:glycosyltransferase family 2 protein [Campylobacterota bacterium DY0563]
MFHQNLDLKKNHNSENNLVLENMINRTKIDVDVTEGLVANSYHLKYLIKNKPLISIIIPFKDQGKLLQTCLNSILNLSSYENFEIIGISNNSKEKETFRQMEIFEQKDSRIKFIEYNVPFNYSHINNYAVKNYSKGEHVVFLNNDIEIISPDWIEALLQYSQQEEIGCVGAKLLYPNNTIQHCGIKVGGENVAQHFLAHLKIENTGYEYRESLVQNVTAVTAACMMIKKTLLEEIDYFDENLTVAYNDVDLCLKAIRKGKTNVFTPYCKAYHYESISRGSDKNGEKLKRLLQEQAILKKNNKEILEKEDLYITDNIFNQMQVQIHDIKNKSILKKIRIYSKPIREKIKKLIKGSK